MNKKVWLLVFLSCTSIIIYTGCAKQEYQTNSKEDRENIESMHQERQQDSNDEYNFFGVWSLDSIVLKSEMYSDDISKNGEIIPVDVEDFLGYELEYNSQFLRIREEKYDDPEYTLIYQTVDKYEEGGKFRLTVGFPSFHEFIENENIKINGMEEYDYLGDIPLQIYDVSFIQEYHIPVGSQLVVLNDDMILIGVWGKIILAHRVIQ